jgi:hypothetical protein
MTLLGTLESNLSVASLTIHASLGRYFRFFFPSTRRMNFKRNPPRGNTLKYNLVNKNVGSDDKIG